MTVKKIAFISESPYVCQMAKAWCQRLKGQEYKAFAIPLRREGLSDKAFQAFREYEFSPSLYSSISIENVSYYQFDYVVFLGMHLGIITGKLNTQAFFYSMDTFAPEDDISKYREIRESIREIIENFPDDQQRTET